MPLAEFLLAQAAEEFNREVTGFDADARKALVNYTWPGNIREMRHKIRAATLFDAVMLNTSKAILHSGWLLLSLVNLIRFQTMSGLSLSGFFFAAAIRWL